MGKYKLLQAQDTATFVDAVSADTPMYYMLKPQFTKQKKAYYSETILVEAIDKGE